MVLLFYNGSEAAGRENFKDIYALSRFCSQCQCMLTVEIISLDPILDLAREIPFEQVNGLLMSFLNGLQRIDQSSFHRMTMLFMGTTCTLDRCSALEP